MAEPIKEPTPPKRKTPNRFDQKRLEVRNKYYPGWWTYGSMDHLPDYLRPLFIIRPKNFAEERLAIESKPAGVRVDILRG